MEEGRARKKRLERSGARRFAYRLALKLGQPNVDRMLRGMTARQFSEWGAYADLEPFDETRADIRTADIVRTLLNLHRKKGAPPLSIKQCLLDFKTAAKARGGPATVEEARAQVRTTMDLLTRIYNAPADKPRPRARRAEKR